MHPEKWTFDWFYKRGKKVDKADNRFYKSDAISLENDLQELAMMIRMLASSLRRYWPHAPQEDDLPSRAVSLLQRKGLMGSPLREIDNLDRLNPPAVDPP